MATIKAVLRKSKQKSDNTLPVYIRISEGTRNKYITVGISVLVKDWDAKMQTVKKSNSNYEYLNGLISKKRSEAEKEVLVVRITESDDEVLDSIDKKNIKKERSNFFVSAELYLKDLYINKKFSRHSADRPRINRFRKFIGKEDLPFSRIDHPLLKKYATYLKNQKKENHEGELVKKCGERTMMNHMVVIRTIYNQAIKDKIVTAHDYPFGKSGFRIKYPETIKIGLNEDEVRLLENADLSGKNEFEHVRNVWLFSFYLAGMRISDVLRLRWDDFSDFRLNYSMGKNQKVVSLKLPDKASFILEQYKSQEKDNNGFVFPDMKNANLKDEENMYRNICRVTGKFDKLLKELATELKIKKPLTNHISRHTFGHITGDKIPPQMLQKLYRHSHISTTMGYQSNFIHKDVDDALETVLNF